MKWTEITSGTEIESIEGLSIRTYACLKRNRVDFVEQVRAMSFQDVTSLRNIGRKSVEELESRLGVEFV
jgi:DNA-directed RNA polymerase alpha subunit